MNKITTDVAERLEGILTYLTCEGEDLKLNEWSTDEKVSYLIDAMGEVMNDNALMNIALNNGLGYDDLELLEEMIFEAEETLEGDDIITDQMMADIVAKVREFPKQ
jgi:hypothetical protein